MHVFVHSQGSPLCDILHARSVIASLSILCCQYNVCCQYYDINYKKVTVFVSVYLYSTIFSGTELPDQLC